MTISDHADYTPVMLGARTEPSTQPTVLWGVPSIAKALNRSERSTYHALENHQIPGAKKIAGRWCFVPEVFYAAMAEPDQ